MLLYSVYSCTSGICIYIPDVHILKELVHLKVILDKGNWLEFQTIPHQLMIHPEEHRYKLNLVERE